MAQCNFGNLHWSRVVQTILSLDQVIWFNNEVRELMGKEFEKILAPYLDAVLSVHRETRPDQQELRNGILFRLSEKGQVVRQPSPCTLAALGELINGNRDMLTKAAAGVLRYDLGFLLRAPLGDPAATTKKYEKRDTFLSLNRDLGVDPASLTPLCLLIHKQIFIAERLKQVLNNPNKETKEGIAIMQKHGALDERLVKLYTDAVIDRTNVQVSASEDTPVDKFRLPTSLWTGTEFNFYVYFHNQRILTPMLENATGLQTLIQGSLERATDTLRDKILGERQGDRETEDDLLTFADCEDAVQKFADTLKSICHVKEKRPPVANEEEEEEEKEQEEFVFTRVDRRIQEYFEEMRDSHLKNKKLEGYREYVQSDKFLSDCQTVYAQTTQQALDKLCRTLF